jgi:CBS domain-containing protein
MAQNIEEVMSPNPFLVTTETPGRAARMMRQVGMGSLIVLEGGAVCGIVTDRDITIRAVAEERDGPTTPVGEVCSREPLTLRLGDSIERTIEVMRTHWCAGCRCLTKKVGRRASSRSAMWPSSAVVRLSGTSVRRLPLAEGKA